MQTTVAAPSEQPTPLPDTEPGSPLFWLHHAIDDGLTAAHIKRMYQRRGCRAADRRALISAHTPMANEADRCWDMFCGRSFR